jgi:uroporphyrinogen decarboxylase
MLRNWMGTEGVSYMLYDNPNLVCECLEFLTDFATRLLARALREVKFDFYYIHEDMSYKNGPLVSPKTFRDLFLPHYKRLVGLLKSKGVEVVLVDTDGNHEVLIPLFIEAGVDGFGPVERAADMDPVKLRKQYGKAVCMVGGIDKRAIAKGRKAIRQAVYGTIVPLIEQGGFIPTIDHAIPPDVSLDDFRYYLDLKRKVIFG